MKTLLDDIQYAINRHSAENRSNTPDFILAQYLEQCLAAFDRAVQQRETWYCRDARPSPMQTQPATPETKAVTGHPNVPGHVSQSTT